MMDRAASYREGYVAKCSRQRQWYEFIQVGFNNPEIWRWLLLRC